MALSQDSRGADLLQPGWYSCIRPDCEQRFWLERPDRNKGYCSRYCANASRLALSPQNPLQRLILEELSRSRQSFRAFAQGCGVSVLTLRNWFVVEPPPGSSAGTIERYGRRDPTISGEVIKRVGERLELDYPEALRLAGGITSEEKLERHRTTQLAIWRSLPPDQRRERSIVAGRAAKRKRRTRVKAQPATEDERDHQ
jgi:hypothetical protein